MELVVVTEVETTCPQEVFKEGQKITILEVELESHAHKKKIQEGESTKREDLVWRRIKLLFFFVILQPSITKNDIKITYPCILE